MEAIMKHLSILVIVAALVMTATSNAEAKTDRDLTYRSSQIWRSAVRFLRVDQNFKVLEKDKDAGYLLFEYANAGKMYSASMEMIPLVKNEKHYVRASIKIEAMPSYVEVVLIDSFVRKLKEEYGVQPPARVVVEAPTGSSAGSDGSGDADAAKKGDVENEEDLEVTEEELEDTAREDD